MRTLVNEAQRIIPFPFRHRVRRLGCDLHLPALGLLLLLSGPVHGQTSDPAARAASDTLDAAWKSGRIGPVFLVECALMDPMADSSGTRRLSPNRDVHPSTSRIRFLRIGFEVEVDSAHLVLATGRELRGGPRGADHSLDPEPLARSEITRILTLVPTDTLRQELAAWKAGMTLGVDATRGKEMVAVEYYEPDGARSEARPEEKIAPEGRRALPAAFPVATVPCVSVGYLERVDETGIRLAKGRYLDAFDSDEQPLAGAGRHFEMSRVLRVIRLGQGEPRTVPPITGGGRRAGSESGD